MALELSQKLKGAVEALRAAGKSIEYTLLIRSLDGSAPDRVAARMKGHVADVLFHKHGGAHIPLDELLFFSYDPGTEYLVWHPPRPDLQALLPY